MRLDEVAKVKTDMPDADFWIQRKGSEGNVGKVLRSYNKGAIGVKVYKQPVFKSTDATYPAFFDYGIVLPQFLSYWMENLFNTGHWKRFAYGSLALKHLRVSDVKRFEL